MTLRDEGQSPAEGALQPAGPQAEGRRVAAMVEEAEALGASSEQVLERGRRQKRTSRRIGYAVVCFATAAILAYYGMNQTFSGLDFWSAVILGVGCLVFGVYQLIIYFKRR